MLRTWTISNDLHRKQIKALALLQFSKKLSTGGTQYGPNKQASIKSQAKVMGKLFGNRIAGSKKRWYPTQEFDASKSNVMFSATQMTKRQGNNTRRMTVLNKLFMKHITDLLATGEASEKILGRGLQVSHVKISSDFTVVNVYWMGSGDAVDDADLEQELKRCSGLMRHELSQLCLMGEVPRIYFVRDKKSVNMAQVERLLRDMDFGEDYTAADITDIVKRDFHWKVVEPAQVKTTDSSNGCLSGLRTPEMRHDVLGLDHRSMMLKIITTMRKSKQAWEQHETTAASKESSSVDAIIDVNNKNHLTSVSQKLASAAAVEEEFDKFLAKRRERKNTPERKKFNVNDQCIDVTNIALERQIIEQNRWNWEERDFIYEEDSGKKPS